MQRAWRRACNEFFHENFFLPEHESLRAHSRTQRRAGWGEGANHAWLVARGGRFALRAAAPGRPCGREAGGLSAEIWGSGSCSGGGRPAESGPLGVRFLSLPKAAAQYEEESGA